MASIFQYLLMTLMMDVRYNLTQFKRDHKKVVPYNYDLILQLGYMGKHLNIFIYYQNMADSYNRPKGRRMKCNTWLNVKTPQIYINDKNLKKKKKNQQWKN